jgi:DNA-binding transcriptional LysR family regulator
VTEANWDLFRLFSVVARTGSVNRAAHELGMSQPTLSRRLKELERHVGAPLFFRASSGVKLTPEGEDLRRSAGDILSAFESFNRELHARLGQRSSVVKISATEGLTKHWLLPRIRRLRDMNSRVRLEITSTMHQQTLATSDLDFVIRMGDPGESELIGKRVATVAFGVFASEAYLAAHPAPRSLAQLKDHDLIGLITEDFAGFRGERANQMHLIGQFIAASEARNTLRILPVASHFAAAAEGLGLALLAVPFGQAEGLVRVLPNESASLNVWLLRRPESDLRKMTREVRRFLESEFVKSRSWFAANQRTAHAPARRRS